MDNVELYQTPNSGLQGDNYAEELVPPSFDITRKAPKELQECYPDLWLRVASQRFAYLQTPWTVILFVMFVLVLWPLALPYLVLVILQRSKPTLRMCKLIEFFVFCLFASGMLMLGGLFGIFGVLIIGSIFLLYEKSARSWHYLFNYMCLTSDEFLDVSLSKGWVKESEKHSTNRSGMSMMTFGSIVILFVVLFLIFA